MGVNFDFPEIRRKAKPLADKIAALVDQEDVDQISAIVAILGALGPLLATLPREQQAQAGLVAMGLIVGATGDLPPADVLQRK